MGRDVIGDPRDVLGDPPLTQYVVHDHPLDYPLKWVVVRALIYPGLVFQERQPFALTDTLEEARAAIPPDLFCEPAGLRGKEESPFIYEVWY